MRWTGDVALEASSKVAEGVRRKAVDGEAVTTCANPMDGIDVDDARALVCTTVGSAVATLQGSG